MNLSISHRLNLNSTKDFSLKDYYPFGMVMPGRNFSSELYTFSFNGKENDNEINENGSSIDFGERIYDSRTSRWLTLDKAADKYTSLSPFGFTNNNPIWLVELDGRIFDIGNMTDDQKIAYQATISRLMTSDIFRYYYGILEKSNDVYTVTFDSELKFGGGYDPQTKHISLFQNNSYLVAQELFHAYQDEGNFYDDDPNSTSNMETEGDIISEYITGEIGEGSPGEINFWGSKILGEEYVDENGKMIKENVLGENFERDFEEVVQNRIDYFIEKDGDNSPKLFSNYTNPKSDASPEAIQKIAVETINHIGPRLENGDFYEK